MKIKKELSEKEKIINCHLLTIEKLKSQIRELKNEKIRQISKDNNEESKTNNKDSLKNDNNLNNMKLDMDLDNQNDNLDILKNSMFSADFNDNNLNNNKNIIKNENFNCNPYFLNDLNKKNFISYDLDINNNNQNIRDILKENEYLKTKYQKYERKYIKHKAINKNYKLILKFMQKEKNKDKGILNKKNFN